ncbi:MarR family winged helix-turn-helix transcriptional regulator [Tetragenococcus koreensis]|uniref:MarR family winged helix-turn-helix transcriptional regulator n=1 Tax=Tetragenococcus koreensis TaxID=290335 RepID=UPI000F4DF92A|nr:MarR family transcriptional regulator [Tetragenococcus koreensis]MDN6391438.1 MarR family transcriptional regulator [Lactococcus lactis]MDN6409228.1 MarR family transcriptional regulator [Tetragenococcus halophilus]MDN6640598.1 MarR family transcriptional regulator [Tetragenococcus sp.]AYW46111.1 MarR family transcriptional regulator [Tetragenococcus koreensis]MCF1627448.1 MarR family transcriptional regulator [Tetragenococcus koreensis]
MENTTDTRLADQLCFSIYNANRLFAKFYQKALEPYHLTYTQYIVLLALWEQDCKTLSDLTKELDLASNTLTPLLKRLESAGWLTRCRAEDDQRQLMVQLTEKGKEQKSAIEKRLEKCMKEQAGINAEQYYRMLADNKNLMDGLKDYLKQPTQEML